MNPEALDMKISAAIDRLSKVETRIEDHAKEIDVTARTLEGIRGEMRVWGMLAMAFGTAMIGLLVSLLSK